MLGTYITIYPWDLIDENVAPVLDRLRGELGVNGVSVWASCPPVTQLRAHSVEPRVFRTRGGLFFHPEEQRYTATRCKPIMSSWVKSRRPLKRIAEACADRGIDLRVVVSAGMTGRLAQRYPEAACKNVFGDRSSLGLCLVNPDVQTYLCSLVSDLCSNYQPGGVTVTDFTTVWAEAFAGELRVPVELGDTETLLLSTCFCESCHQRASTAGVDVAMARRSVQTVLQRSIDGGAPSGRDVDTVLADAPPLEVYYRWRRDELSALLRRLAETCTTELLLDRHPDGVRCGQHPEVDLSLPAAVITRIDEPGQLTFSLCPAARRSELRVSEAFCGGRCGPELVSTLTKAVELGLAGVVIDSYGLLPEPALTPIKQALRFARRSSAG